MSTTVDDISYFHDRRISADEFIDVLRRSTLDQRRPVDDIDRVNRMLEHGNILITAWDDDLLVGVSRALSDFSFCCYLSDLAVDEAYQKKGIGKQLVAETRRISGEETTLILHAAPAAVSYYPKIGMEKFEHCFIIPKTR